jgi:hypothetical protein
MSITASTIGALGKCSNASSILISTVTCVVTRIRVLSKQSGKILKTYHLLLSASTFDLVEQYIAAPAELCRGAQVVEACGGVDDFVQDGQVLSSRNFCNSLSHRFDSLPCIIQFGYRL